MKLVQKHSAALWWLDREHHVLVWGAGRFIAAYARFSELFWTVGVLQRVLLLFSHDTSS